MGKNVVPEEGRAGDAVVGRRAVLYGGAGVVGAAALAGCASAPKQQSAEDLRGKEIAKVAEIPVGGGRAYATEKIVVTQPTEGEFKAFTAVCPHQGCAVNQVQNGVMVCPCHRSEFKITDGSVTRGPAEKGLMEYPVQVQGDGIVVT